MFKIVKRYSSDSISHIPTNTKGKLYLGDVSSVKEIDKYNIKFVISLYPINNRYIPNDII